MKKTLSVFFSCYILILSLTPCVDKEISASCAKYAGMMSHDNAGHEDHQDSCSPFCTCSCCSLPFQIEKPFIDFQFHSLPQIVSFFYSIQIESHYRFSIWEPPKG